MSATTEYICSGVYLVHKKKDTCVNLASSIIPQYLPFGEFLFLICERTGTVQTPIKDSRH